MPDPTASEPHWSHGKVQVTRDAHALTIHTPHMRWWAGIPELGPLPAPTGIFWLDDDPASFARLLLWCERWSAQGLARVLCLQPAQSHKLSALLEFWSRGWPDGVHIDLDTVHAGLLTPCTPLEVRFDGEGGLLILHEDVKIVLSSKPHRLAGANLGLLRTHAFASDPRTLAALASVGTLWFSPPKPDQTPA